MRNLLTTILLVAALGGNALAQTTTTNLGVTKVTQTQAQKEVTINEAFDKLDRAEAGLLTKNVAGSADITLSASEAYYKAYVFTGALTGNISVKIPYSFSSRAFVVYNNTSGAFTLTVKTTYSGSLGAAIAQGSKLTVFHDGVNVYATSGSGVNSFNTRTGAVTSQSGDYNFNQLSGTATDAQVPDTITASNYLPLAGGTVTGATTVSNTSNPQLAVVSSSSSVSTVLELKDAGGAPNRMWFFLGKNSATDGVFSFYDARRAAFRFTIDTSGNFDLTTGAFSLAGTTVIDSSRNATLVDVTVRKLLGSGSTPTCTVNGAAGLGATCSVSGTDLKGEVTLNTGTGVISGSTVTVTFATAFSAAPHVVFSAANNKASGPIEAHVTTTTTTFTITLNAVVADSQTFKWKYHS